MKALFLMVAIVIQLQATAQTVGDLDKKGGFKEYKINDSLSVHKDKIKFTKTLENADTKLYLVKELVSVKTYTGEIELKFYKEKIVEVIVSYKNTTKDNFEDIKASLEVLYGKSQPNKEKLKKLERFEKVYVWNGEVIGLRIGYDANRKLTEMVYYGQKNQLDKLKDEF